MATNNLSSQQYSTIKEKSLNNSNFNNIFEWQTQDVCKFFTSLVSKKFISEIGKQLVKHQINGIDLLELSEKNLSEIGVQSIHDRKNIIRTIKNIKNNSSLQYGIISVVMLENNQEKKIKLKISDFEIKVKQILSQALQAFNKSKYDLGYYGLIKQQNQQGKETIILTNSSKISSFTNPIRLEEFFIVKISDVIDQISEKANNITNNQLFSNKNSDKSLERLLQSPSQKIYVQTMEDTDQVIQQNTSNSESQINFKQSGFSENRNNFKNSLRQNQKNQNHVQNGHEPNQIETQVIQIPLQENRDLQNSNLQNNSNYLQNYLTSSKQSHQKFSSTNQFMGNQSDQLSRQNPFNDTAFHYPITQQKIQMHNNNFNQNEGCSTAKAATNLLNFNLQSQNHNKPLSRENSVQKSKKHFLSSNNEKSISKGSGQKTSSRVVQKNIVTTKTNNYSGNKRDSYTLQYQQQLLLHKQQTNNQKNISSFEKQNKRLSTLQSKNINMYSTLNGNNNVSNYSNNNNQQTAGKKNQPIIISKQKVEIDTMSNDDYIRTINETLLDTNRNHFTPSQIRQNIKDHIAQSNNSRENMVSKQNFTQNLDTCYSYQNHNLADNNNNLNEIFSDFIDEQSQIIQYQQQLQKRNENNLNNQRNSNVKLISNNFNSRQQFLMEEDSLESNKKNHDNHMAYLQDDQVQNDLKESQIVLNNLSSNLIGTQRTGKHQQHKSMYALNSNKLNQNNSRKSFCLAQTSKAKQNYNQYYGTFDNSKSIINYNSNNNQNHNLTKYCPVTSMSDYCKNEQTTLNENYNIANINQDIMKQQQQNQYSQRRINDFQIPRQMTIELETDKENNSQSSNIINSILEQRQIEMYEKNNNFNDCIFDEQISKRATIIGTVRRKGEKIFDFKDEFDQKDNLASSPHCTSDGNTNKHENHRYNDQCDDLIMLDTSEEESVLIKKRY